jgi:hypothetical protein
MIGRLALSWIIAGYQIIDKIISSVNNKKQTIWLAVGKIGSTRTYT